MRNLSNFFGATNSLPVLQAGSKGAYVIYAQKILMFASKADNDSSYDLPDYGADGDYGNETINAVKNYQDKIGIPSTGIIDDATWASFDLYSHGLQEPVAASVVVASTSTLNTVPATPLPVNTSVVTPGATIATSVKNTIPVVVAPVDNTKKYIAYGVGGLIVVAGIFYVMKKNKK